METRKALNKVNTKELAGMALLSAILLIGQVGLSFLPNIEIVSLLIYIYTQIYRKKVFWKVVSMASGCGGLAISIYGVFWR